MKTVSLGDVAAFGNGGTPSRANPDYWDGTTPWITGADIAEDQTVTARSFITDEAVSKSSTQVYPEGTVVLVTRTSIGKVGVLTERTAINQDLTAIRPCADLHSGYLVHFLRTSSVVLARQARGATIKGVTRAAVEGLRFPLPSLDEQRRIAAILDHADALRAKRRQVLAHLDALTQSIFHAMFGTRPWDSTVGELAHVQIGPFGSLLHQEDYVSGGVPILNPTHIQNGALVPDPEFSVTEDKASSLELYRLREDDVVLGRRGAMGRAGVATRVHIGMLCGTGSLILRPKQVDSTFLHAVLTSPRMRGHLERNSLGATLPNLNAAIVKASPAPDVPSEAQRIFRARVERVRANRVAVERVLGAQHTLFASLQSRAFRGGL